MGWRVSETRRWATSNTSASARSNSPSCRKLPTTARVVPATAWVFIGFSLRWN